MSDQYLEAYFPTLLDSRYSITSPADIKYNCIAWAAGNNDMFWWPDQQGYYFWPDDKGEATIEAFIAVFQQLGYELCINSVLEVNFEKIAIYAIDDVPKHVARQLSSGEWTSKCGELQDITHTLEGLEGSEYGTVVVVLKRVAKPL